METPLNDAICASPPDIAPPPIELSRLECLGAVVISPAKAFEQLSRKPQWLMPLIIVMLWVLIVFVLRMSIIMVMAFSKFGKEIPVPFNGSFLSFIQVFTAVFSTGLYFVGGVLGSIVVLLMMACALLVIAKIFGSRSNFFPLASCLAYAEFVPALTRVSLKYFIPLMTGNYSAFYAELPTGLLELAGGFSYPQLLGPLLRRIELFHLWSFVLVTISLQCLLRVQRNKAVVITALYWLVCIAALIGVEALQDFLFGLSIQ
ncbi:YIP1 family protein [Candidatus Poribacteria bacterium]|nr:YIP1 family protein [Candidatus Poribacteria bacterium]